MKREKRQKGQYLATTARLCGGRGAYIAHIPVGPGSQTEPLTVCTTHADVLRRSGVTTWALRRDYVAGTWVRMDELPNCDLCAMLGVHMRPARYDGATIHGPWAFMCEDHFRDDGIGLGTGRGQRLILPNEKTPKGDAK